MFCLLEHHFLCLCCLLVYRTAISNTPSTLRRSLRGTSKHPPTSPNPNDTPSAVISRTTRSQLNPDIITKQKYMSYVNFIF